jgi:glycosyltransferase involved in cell wall biosynthesis
VFAGSNVVRRDGASPAAGHASRRILFVGRDWERKGGPDLLAAFEIVRPRHPGARLIVAGCSPRIDVEGVTVLGEVDPGVLSQEYRRAAVFCLPTLVEPFGIVFVEALTHGLPVVATSVGAVPDIVQDGETGYLTTPRDVSGLADRLSALLSDPQQGRRFGELGRQRVRERYTWPAVVEAMAGHIRGVLESGERETPVADAAAA